MVAFVEGKLGCHARTTRLPQICGSRDTFPALGAQGLYSERKRQTVSSEKTRLLIEFVNSVKRVDLIINEYANTVKQVYSVINERAEGGKKYVGLGFNGDIRF